LSESVRYLASTWHQRADTVQSTCKLKWWAKSIWN